MLIIIVSTAFKSKIRKYYRSPVYPKCSKFELGNDKHTEYNTRNPYSLNDVVFYPILFQTEIIVMTSSKNGFGNTKFRN